MLLVILLYFSLLALPVIALAAWDLTRVVRRRRAAKRLASKPKSGPAPARAIRQPGRSEVLEGRWIAIRAQFLVAPYQALREAEDLLSSLSPDGRRQPIPTPAGSAAVTPQLEMLRLQAEFERLLSRR
jgi:hypothetical protein